MNVHENSTKELKVEIKDTRQFLEDFFDSLQAQTVKNFETIIVNNGSNLEETIKTLNKFSTFTSFKLLFL